MTREDELWRAALLGTNPAQRAGRAFFAALPSPPRCQLCATPFKGPFAPFLGLIGKRPFPRNPRYCAFCVNAVLKKKVGAEVEMTALFADVRESTPMSERLGATAFHGLMDRFYRTGVEALIQSGAIVDRFVGDQVVGYFVPGFAGRAHAERALRAGFQLLKATGHGAGEPWVPVGAGVHTGIGFIGTVGTAGGMMELTALGEDVTIAARLASVAGTGELVCTEATYRSAGVDVPGERRELSLKGVSLPVPVRVLRAASVR